VENWVDFLIWLNDKAGETFTFVYIILQFV